MERSGGGWRLSMAVAMVVVSRCVGEILVGAEVREAQGKNVRAVIAQGERRPDASAAVDLVVVVNVD